MRKVASRSSQHSKMLGQPAASHTVCRPSRFTSDLSSVYSGPIVARVLIQDGFFSIGVSALRTSSRSSLRPSGAIVTPSRVRRRAQPARSTSASRFSTYGVASATVTSRPVSLLAR